MRTTIFTSRVFLFTMCGGDEFYTESHSLKSVLSMFNEKNPTEWSICIAEDFDSLLDLKKGESMYFDASRDDKQMKAIALRIA